MTRLQMMRPRALAPRSRIALVAPAGPLDAERIERSADRCRSLGLEPIVFPSAGARRGYLAGTDEERLRDLQAAFDDPAVDGVWALRGGYGTMRLVDRLDLERQRRAPIPFLGFSDNTTLLARHVRLGVIAFHAPHPGGALPTETMQWLERVLFGAEAPGPLPLRPEDPQPRTLVGGRAEGRLFGGNLAILAALCGSPESGGMDGGILFLEDVGESAYRIDRMLVQLVRAGVTDGVVGLALGRFTGVDGEDDPQVAGVLSEFALELGVPTVADLPFGHVDHNCVLPVGGLAVLEGDAGSLSLTEPAVTALF